MVLLRPGAQGLEVLLTQRPATMAFAPDMHVFPGGRVDPGDADPRLASRVAGPAEPARVAALRELFEEAGVLLADRTAAGGPSDAALAVAREGLLAGATTIADVADDLDLRLRTDLLAPIGHWTTPPVMARRFDTRFFAAELPPGVEPTFATDEVVGHRWLTPRAALEAMAGGEIGMWVPTATTLQQLEHAASLDQIRDRLAPGPTATPRVVVESPSVTRIELSEAGSVAGQTVNTYVVGRRQLVVVDPGDPSDSAADAILELARERDGRIVVIALTHVDPDHAAGAEGLALRLGIPIVGGPGASRPLPYEVRELGDGDRVPGGDVELAAISTPGVRPDHLAFVVGGSGGVIVGDVLGSQAGRSILAPLDDGARDISLARLQRLGLERAFRGHGGPVSGVATRPGSGGG